MYHMVSLKFENPTAEFVCPGPRIISQEEVKRHFPLISPDFKWGVVVYDGEMDDSRLLMETLLTSSVDNYDDSTGQD
jgi:glycerol-3-phosphate dehydrogenase